MQSGLRKQTNYMTFIADRQLFVHPSVVYLSYVGVSMTIRAAPNGCSDIDKWQTKGWPGFWFYICSDTHLSLNAHYRCPFSMKTTDIVFLWKFSAPSKALLAGKILLNLNVIVFLSSLLLYVYFKTIFLLQKCSRRSRYEYEKQSYSSIKRRKCYTGSVSKV